MKVAFSPAFLKQLEKLEPSVKEAAKKAVGRVIDFYENGEYQPGLGVKRLRGPVWEARSGLKIRVVYLLEGGSLRFVLTGSHDDVKRFLSRAT